MSNNEVDLRNAIRNVDSLPAMPVVAQKILTLPLDTHEGEDRLLHLIVQDPQLSARIIGLANCPLFGASKRVTSVGDAAMLLGITRIKSVAMGIAVMSTLSRRPSGRLNMQQLWLHSLAIALAMRTLARAMPGKLRPQDDDIFFAGLLHDIGFMALNYLDPALSDQLQSSLAAAPERPVSAVEAEVLTIGHGELGAELARHWDLPENIVAVLRYHHTPDAAGAQAGQPLINLLHLAEKLLPDFGIAEHAEAVTEQDWLRLQIDPARAEELQQQVTEQGEQARAVAAAF